MASRRHFARFVVLAAVAATSACQPLYGGKPEKLKNPEKKKRPPEAEAAAQPKYIEDCEADFRGDPGRVRAQPAIAAPLTAEGATALRSAETSKDPSAQVELITLAIDKLRNALTKDPYNAEATLQLAIAYDRVYRKGCALALLKRLAALSANPKYAKDADRAVGRITDQESWFKGYRKDAISAVGR
ncbi:MAG: hypothetical protein AB7P03_06645 [Kofleriaceae bacterium]